MSMQPRFETTRETAVISEILADLVRTVQLIECEIAVQEERAGVSDRSDVKYPMLARALIERRDNLKMTIDALKQRLAERGRTSKHGGLAQRKSRRWEIQGRHRLACSDHHQKVVPALVVTAPQMVLIDKAKLSIGPSAVPRVHRSSMS